MARFSDIVDDFTHYDMTDAEAIHCAMYECDCGAETAQRKIDTARQAGKTRWDDELNTIRMIHGEKRLKECLAEMGFG